MPNLLPEAYWKLKCRIAECNLLQEQGGMLLGRSNELRAQALKEAELDTTKVYNLTDNSFSAEEVKG